uniref:Uncharacterized protein n=1 Tax=Anguilla anguilla TaxID=7936 RepID=A0A0E9WT37_ANGAN
MWNSSPRTSQTTAHAWSLLQVQQAWGTESCTTSTGEVKHETVPTHGVSLTYTPAGV